jgi:hypothetical protein
VTKVPEMVGEEGVDPEDRQSAREAMASAVEELVSAIDESNREPLVDDE